MNVYKVDYITLTNGQTSPFIYSVKVYLNERRVSDGSTLGKVK